jgi:hypothetical protein
MDVSFHGEASLILLIFLQQYFYNDIKKTSHTQIPKRSRGTDFLVPQHVVWTAKI